MMGSLDWRWGVLKQVIDKEIVETKPIDYSMEEPANQELAPSI